MCVSIFKKKLLPPPEPLVDIGYQDIINILKPMLPDANIYLSDSKYYTTTLDELKRFLKSDNTNEYRYVSEYYDCDDFSFRLMGQIHCVDWGALPFGIVWTETPAGGHAINIFIDNEKKVWIIEPQNDSVFILPSDWKPYLVII